jgi:uncharacterized phage protein gp47/JayE
MFQIKNFPSIVASMINQMRGTQDKVTDFNVGSVARALVEAPAVEIDELYQQMFIGLREAIPVAIYNSFQFGRLPALPATGRVRVTITSSASDTLIPADTVFKIENGLTDYESVTDVTIDTGDTFADVLVQARTVGLLGNIPAGKSFTLDPTLSNLVSATNLAAFSTGADEESDDQRKARFARFIATLPRGTVASIQYGLSLADLRDDEGDVVERVAYAAVVEPYLLDDEEPIALVRCYLHNGLEPASSELVSRAAEVIAGYTDDDGNKVAGWKAAGVKVEIFPAEEVVVDVTATITALTGYVAATLAEEAETKVSDYLLGIPMGTTGNAAIRAEIISIIMSIEGIYNVTLTAPVSDTAADYNEKIMPGTMAIT